MLLGVDPMDPIALAGATAVLLLVVLAASQGPALHAARLTAMEALRHE
jgi:ABC-type lipoprotein release transport system permease subunit